MKMILYSYFRSSASYRVRIALNIKQIAFEYRPVHLVKGQQWEQGYQSINPSQQVPTLMHGDFVIGQSMAILDYLESIKAPRLFPTDAAQRALVIQACEIVNSGIQPLQNSIVNKALEEDFKASDEQKSEWNRKWIGRGLKAYQGLISKYAGTYCFGDQLSAADCFLVPQIFVARRFKLDLNPFPLLLRLDDNLRKLEAFQKAAPENQPDFEK